MPVTRLSTIQVAKPWGRHDLWQGFDDPPADEEAVGEVWFDAPADVEAELMVKYLFTSERLSIQVHPDDAQARAAGYPRGKEEAWVVLAAQPESTIALGTIRPLSADELRAASLDGSIEALVEWRPVCAGDVIYSPAGTVHAIGAGITLVEVQQNVDLTYRLYDYGRPRELHLDQGMAVSRAVPFADKLRPETLAPGRTLLVRDRKFILERWNWNGVRTLALPPDLKAWLTVISGTGRIGDQPLEPGSCWLVTGETSLVLDSNADILFAHTGPEPLARLG
jgi:mannose-6-phosphate isomerase